MASGGHRAHASHRNAAAAVLTAAIRAAREARQGLVDLVELVSLTTLQPGEKHAGRLRGGVLRGRARLVALERGQLAIRDDDRAKQRRAVALEAARELRTKRVAPGLDVG